MPEVASQVYKSRTGATEMGFLDRRSWFVGLRWGSGTGDLKWEGGGGSEMVGTFQTLLFEAF